MNIKNVIIVNDFNYVQGGASKVALDTARLLRDNGMNVYFFCAVSKEKENMDGITYITTNQSEALSEKNKLKGFINGIYNIKARESLKKLLKKLKKEETIIHIHGWTKALSSSVFDIAFKMDFKVVLTLHEYFTICPNGALFNHKTCKVCDKKGLSFSCVKCNCDSRNYLFKMYRVVRSFVQNNLVKLNKRIKYAIGISDMSIEILKPFFNSDIVIKKIYNPIKLEKNISNENIRKNEYYLYVGRIEREKGVETFCKVITELKLKGIVVGDGKEKDKLEKLYKNIEFTGWKKSNEVSKYMKNAEALIVPSIWYESAGLTIIEAQMLNTPCIISKYCSGREFLKNGCVFLDKDDLKKCIIEKKYLKERNIDFSDFDEQVYVKKIIEFYNE